MSYTKGQIKLISDLSLKTIIIRERLKKMGGETGKYELVATAFWLKKMIRGNKKKTGQLNRPPYCHR